MADLVSLLVLLLISLACMKSSTAPNNLLDFGILLLAGYLFGVIAKRFRIPPAAGYVLAGIIISPHGLGFLNESFQGNFTLIESIFFMLLISKLFRSSGSQESASNLLKHIAGGAGTVLLTVTGAFLLLSLTNLALSLKIMFSLFAGSFSPLMAEALDRSLKKWSPALPFTLGAYITAFVLWSVFAGYYHHPEVWWPRMAILPVVVALTSTVAGIVWCFAVEKILYRTNLPAHSLFPLASLLLLYPFVQMGSLDIIFTGIGVGIYNSIFSDRKPTALEQSDISGLIIFTLFGTRLALDDAVLLSAQAWMIAGILTAVIAATRGISVLLAGRVLTSGNAARQRLASLFAYGPMSLMFIHRFGPAFVPQGTYPAISPLPLMTTVMMLIATFTPLILLIHGSPSSQKNSN